ncbi:hypothetical protein Hanom_Chr16g01503911 [Helianthus anomalus]
MSSSRASGLVYTPISSPILLQTGRNSPVMGACGYIIAGTTSKKLFVIWLLWFTVHWLL